MSTPADFLDRLQSELTGGLARMLASMPDRPVRELMRTPLRRPVLETVFWALPRALNGTRAHEVTTAVRCHVTGRPDGGIEIYLLEYADGRWSARQGSKGAEPELTITVDGAELLLLACRSSSPVEAYLAGKLRASGNPMLAARLTMLLRSFPPRDGAPSAAAER
ncbi:MAG TPA: SCP2 sterol-binding domain-containing protein [Solirubrobacteraceae bacterium]|nr:SCP2 sterol-binding domain-containing protein [Solirubrobacteraceae bacterium]